MKRVLRALLRLLPEEIRSLYQSEIETTFETEARESHDAKGRLSVVGLWLAFVADILRTAPSEHLDILKRDTRFALRTMAQRRLETATAVLTLALVIGANVAMFAVVDSVLLAPLPYDKPGDLVTIGETERGGDPSNLGYLTFVDLRDRARGFSSLVAATMSTATLSSGPAAGGAELPAERVNAMRASHDYFDLLGVQPYLGRSFTELEDQPGEARRVVVLSDSLFQRRYGGDPELLDSVIDISGREYRVVGVMPPGFQDLVAERLYNGAELWYPLGYDPAASFACRDCRHLRVFGRLVANTDIETAERELAGLFSGLEAEHPSAYHEASARVTRLADVFLGPVRTVLLVLWVGVGALLLIGCANVANLLMLRAGEREHEVAVRSALGITTGRLVRQLITESVLLSLLGGVASLLPAWAALRLLAVAGPSELPRLASVSFDTRVFALALVVTLASGLLFGLVPLRQLSRTDVSGAMHGSGRRTGSRRTGRTRSVLLAASVALAVILLVGSGLLVRSLGSLLAIDPGFDPAGVLTMSLWAGGERFRKSEPAEQIAAAVGFYDELLSEMATLPQVVAAGAVTTLPMGGNIDRYGFHIVGDLEADPSLAPSADRFVVTPGFFPVMRIPLLRGRLLDERDRQDTLPVAVINRTAEAQLFAGQSALGRQVSLGPPSAQERTIVGIVEDIRHHGLEVPVETQVYVPQAQWAWAETAMTLVLRTTGDPGSLSAAVRDVARRVDPSQPVSHFEAYSRVVAAATGTRRFAAGLLSLFAAAALLLALVGLYSAAGVVVGQRRPEIGLRLALGARARTIRRMILAQELAPVGAGLVIGLTVAAASMGALRSLLFDVEPLDPGVFGSAVTVLLLTAVGACWLPAWRASRINPSRTLRAD